MTGTAVTFYSYKGGVGRSFALANTAVLLSSWGYRTLCVDWDLDAPGLPFYFSKWMPQPLFGLVDLVHDYVAGTGPDPRDYVQPVRLVAGEGARLDLLAAGSAADSYVRRAQAIDWERLYRTHDLGGFLERCRNQWLEEYDFVLIDSRTGITDVGGICTAQLPDILVVLFTANEQSLRGVVDVSGRAEKARDDLPYDRARLMKLPVAARFDSREEYARAAEWQRRFLLLTEPLAAEWLADGIPFEKVLTRLTIPYVSYWSFGEEIPALAEPEPSAEHIGYSLQTLAAFIARRMEGSDLLADNRDSFVESVASGGRGYRYDVYLSCSDDARPEAGQLRDLLVESGLTVFDSTATRLGEDTYSETMDAAGRSQHLLALVGGAKDHFQNSEINRFLRLRLSGGGERRVLPVLLPSAGWKDVPKSLQDIQFLRVEDPSSFPEAAGEIVRTLHDWSRPPPGDA